MKRVAGAFCLLLVWTTSAVADKNTGKGQGAIVISDSATVYEDSEGDDAFPTKLEKGEAVGGFSKLAGLVDSYQFEDQNGRVRVLTVSKNGRAANGWMNRADLSSYFSYECGCGLTQAKCSPHVLERFHYKWNICFEEAREKKVADLEKAQTPAPAAESSESAETRLQKLNDLYKKGLITKEDFEKKKAEILKSM
jgi:Short C-terminal domain